MLTALFDKSFLQSLSVDESVWFDHFFYPVVCPLFYVETLSDLDKAVREGRTPEQEVGIIADKTPEMHGGPCMHHDELCIAELYGNSISMTGQIPVGGGRPVKVGDQSGVIYEVSPERQAFSRWQERKFLDVERLFAKTWRALLAGLDLGAIAESIKASGIAPQSCTSLAAIKTEAERLVGSQGPTSSGLELAFRFLRIPAEDQACISSHWRDVGSPPLPVYAPYTSHVVTVEVFFQMAVAGGFISSARASNRADIAYLFYLPFCTIFISSDRLHRRCAPLFLRPNQEFVWGLDLKADLARLNQHYLLLPDDQKEGGIMAFAGYPPKTGNYLVTQLWDRHLSEWRKHSEISKRARDPVKERALVDRLKQFTNANTASKSVSAADIADVDVLSIQRSVRKKKGSWWQLPRDLE